jgi:hypothetical protein
MHAAGESGASEQTPPKIKAEDNPCYLLATLYGAPQNRTDRLLLGRHIPALEKNNPSALPMSWPGLTRPSILMPSIVGCPAQGRA